MDVDIEEDELGWVATGCRGAGCFLAWLLGPSAALFGLACAGCKPAFVWLLGCFGCIYPHQWFVWHADNHAAFAGNGAMIAAIVQWGIATIVFSLMTCRLALKLQIFLAPSFIFAVSVLVYIVVFLFGIDVQFPYL
jgi:hypothetical protein